MNKINYNVYNYLLFLFFLHNFFVGKAYASQTELKRVGLSDICNFVSVGLKWKLSYILLPPDPKTKTSNDEYLNEMLKMPPEDRTKLEIQRIDLYENLFKKHPEMRSWEAPNETKYTVSLEDGLSPSIIEKNLKKIVTLNPAYYYQLSNTMYLFFPKNDILAAKKISLSLKNVSIAEAIKAFRSILEPLGIDDSSMVFMGENYPDKTITLNLDKVSLIDALSRLCESINPDLSWYIMGGGGNYRRNLIITQFR